MVPSLWARLLRWFALKPYFKGKTRIETLLSRWISMPPMDVGTTFPDGFTMMLNPDAWADRWLYFRDCEPDVAHVLRQHLQPGGVFIDAGANVGFYSLLASSLVGPSGQVYAFEPMPVAHACAKRNLEQNRSSNVVLFHAALGAARAEADIYWNGDNHTLSSLRARDGVDQVCGRCQVLALDDMVADGSISRSPDVVKIDVEGSEMDVLKGAQRLIRGSRPPLLIIELNRNTQPSFGYEPEAIIGFVTSLNRFSVSWPFYYRHWPVSAGQPLPHLAQFGCNHGGNYLFVPQGR